MTRYLDMTNAEGCIGFLPENGETVVCTGVSIYSMPLSVKKKEGREYARFAHDYGISFIFDDCIPTVDFYTVPRVEIAAVDDAGGYIASVGDPFSLWDSVPLIYISKDRKCWLITGDSKQFLSIAPRWRDHLQPFDGVRLYPSKEEARKDYPITDVESLPEYQQLMKLLEQQKNGHK